MPTKQSVPSGIVVKPKTSSGICRRDGLERNIRRRSASRLAQLSAQTLLTAATAPSSSDRDAMMQASKSGERRISSTAHLGTSMPLASAIASLL
eukprot:scaffold6978_cov64-Phaeocystis_antarctica.AAC.13